MGKYYVISNSEEHSFFCNVLLSETQVQSLIHKLSAIDHIDLQ